MTITYRKLTENDLDTFIKIRIDQLREEGGTLHGYILSFI